MSMFFSFQKFILACFADIILGVFHRVFDHQYFRRLYMLLSMLMLGMASLQFYSLVEEWEGVTVSGVYNLGVGLWIHETLCQVDK